MNLLRNIEVVPSSGVAIGVPSTIFSSYVDARDCEGVLFIVAGCSNYTCKTGTTWAAHLQGSTYSSGGWANIGSTILVTQSTQTRTNNERKVSLVDCYKPLKPYVRLAVYHSSGWAPVVAVKYGLRRGGSTGALDSTKISDWALAISST